MSSERDPAVAAQCEALAAPFDPKEVKFKPQMVKNNRALAMPYIDARVVQDRLDQVVGVDGWQDRYAILPDGSVVCTLRVRLGGRWVTKTDVGSPSEQPDGGDRLKAAFSDALKRAAVKFGVGRYLYRLSASWVDYDPVKKQLTQVPQLPARAVPKPTQIPPPAPPEEAARGRIAAAATLAELAAAWGTFPAAVRERVAGDKDRRKAELSRPAPPHVPGVDEDPAPGGRLFDGGESPTDPSAAVRH